jgi:hypothetical protein
MIEFTGTGSELLENLGFSSGSKGKVYEQPRKPE